MKNLFELRRSRKVKYKADPEKARQYYRNKHTKRSKEEYKKITEKPKRKICRVVPWLVADNIDRFLELPVPSSVEDIETDVLKVRRAILSKDQ